MNSIERLAVLLDALDAKARKTDSKNSHCKAHRFIENNNLFSSTLFASKSDRFIVYVNEVRRRVMEFSRLVGANKIALSKALLQQIEQQISAITNALQSNAVMHQAATLSFDANNKVRIKKSKVNQANKYSNIAKRLVLSSHQLYQKLTEHHEFERRLMDMVSEKEHARMSCKSHDSERISLEVLTLHQRLGRCRKAISVIERDIEQAEKR